VWWEIAEHAARETVLAPEVAGDAGWRQLVAEVEGGGGSGGSGGGGDAAAAAALAATGDDGPPSPVASGARRVVAVVAVSMRWEVGTHMRYAHICIHTYTHAAHALHARRTHTHTRTRARALPYGHGTRAACAPHQRAACIHQARAKRQAQRLMQLSQGGGNQRREASHEGGGAAPGELGEIGGELGSLERESYRAEVQRELKAKAREAAHAQEQLAVLTRQLAERDDGIAPPAPARGEWAGRSEGELEQALEGASAALSAAQHEADRQEAAAAELERQRDELDAELGARQREYEEMEARLRELQAAAMQGQL
jgi:hypothetical protein